MRSLLSLLLWTTWIAFAGEYAVLENGRRLHIDHHQDAGSKVHLFIGSGSIEMNAVQVRSFEVEEYVPSTSETASSPFRQSVPAPQPALSPQQLADRAAEKYGLPRALVRSVMKAESGFAPFAVSQKGAIGLMQLMPATAQILGADPHDPAANVDAGARYLRELLEKYDGGLRHALAAYNAGPAAVEKYQGVPPYPETLNYIRRVEQDFKKAD
jgi:soluble lytic murein transglycosylase-like protein